MESDAQVRWERLVGQILASGEATYGNAAADGPKRAFGATSLKTGGKIFAMLVHDRLVVKLPAGRVSALVDDGMGEPFDPGHGRVQKEWLSLSSEDPAAWRAIASEAEAFIARRSK